MLKRRFSSRRRMTREDKAKEEMEWRKINEDIELEREGVEPLLDSYFVYATEVHTVSQQRLPSDLWRAYRVPVDYSILWYEHRVPHCERFFAARWFVPWETNDQSSTSYDEIRVVIFPTLSPWWYAFTGWGNVSYVGFEVTATEFAFHRPDHRY